MNEVSEYFTHCIARAHLHGEGKSVREIWERIARGDMLEDEVLIWAKKIADWIVMDPPMEEIAVDGEATKERASRRVAAIHVGLTISGASEPKLDTLEDEHFLFLCATGERRLRGAAEAIWKKIQNGTATQLLRERWLDHISDGVVNVINKNLEPKPKQQYLQNSLGLGGKLHEHNHLNLIEVLYRVRALFPISAYSNDPRKYVDDFIRRLRKFGIIKKDDQNIARHLREMMRKQPPFEPKETPDTAHG